MELNLKYPRKKKGRNDRRAGAQVDIPVIENDFN